MKKAITTILIIAILGTGTAAQIRQGVGMVARTVTVTVVIK